MAYVDRELDPATAAAIDAACAQDPQLAARVQRHRQLRVAVHGAYATTLSEPVPDRLLSLARGAEGATSAPAAASAPAPKVVDLAAARAAREARAETPPRRAHWSTWGALAASVAIGVWIGSALLREPLAPGETFATAGGRLLARSALAQALDQQLTSTQAETATVHVGLSFVSREGLYCRTFSLRDPALRGLACKNGADWRVQTLAQAGTNAEQPGGYRMAASPVPEAVLRSVDQMIQGAPLEAAAEVAAQQHGWKR
ncbi:MAG TPA: hypothetical protein VF229_05635 [Burkholderiaceae bacterium]